VRPVNDAPTLAAATFSLAENSPNGTGVGTASGADVDDTDLRYRIVSGNVGGAFAIDPITGQITVANSAVLDFETIQTFALNVEVRDPAGLTATATVTVNLTDVITQPQIDIDPGDSRNRINHRSTGRVSVAIFSAPEFDVRQIDITSLRFGRTGTEDSLSRNDALIPRVRFVDLNHDGLLDMVVDFDIPKTGFQPGDPVGILTGELLNGFVFTAQDMVAVK
jgi:hypothetical protein